jgi:hypothetical protein
MIGTSSPAAAPEYTSRDLTAVTLTLAQNLPTQDEEQAVEVIRAFQESCDRFVISLLKIVDSEHDGRVKADERRAAAASEVLAYLRRPEAIRIFVRRIDQVSRLVAEEPGPLGPYPYALALISYGDAAIPEILTLLKHDGIERISDKAIELYAHVLISCAGHARKAIESVEREIVIASTDEQRGLRRVLARLQAIAQRQREHSSFGVQAPCFLIPPC